VLSCRSRSCSVQCGTTCGGTFGAIRPKHLANNPKCAECYRTNACDENITCTNNPACLRVAGCHFSCSLLDRSCLNQCRFPLGDQPGAEAVTTTMKTKCRTDCRDGADWSCVDVSKYTGGPAPGEVDFRFIAENVAKPSEKMKGVTFRPCLDADCALPAGKSCTSDENGYCAATIEISSAGNVFPGLIEGTGEGIYPTLYSFHPQLTGVWPGTPAYTPENMLVIPKALVEIGGPIADVTVIEGRGHIIVAFFDCLWSPAEKLKLSVARGDDKTVYRYVVEGLPSRDATMTDQSGVAYAFNVPASKEKTTITAKLGDRVVAETAMFVRANAVSFGLVGPR
jgi:hypothetical protein